MGSFAIHAKIAEAGFFGDFIEKVFADSGPDEEHQLSTQSMPLLSSLDETAVYAGEYMASDQGALLPAAGPTGGLAQLTDLQAQTAAGTISTYTVAEGDTIASIATTYGISANTVLWANGLNKKSKLKVGQNLVILPITSVQHKVGKGDTVQKIAKKYGGDVDEIVSYNDIEDGKLVVGEVIIIPDGEMPAVVAPPKSGSGKGMIYSGKDIKGYFIAPLAAYRKTQSIHGHNGVDLVAPVGTPIRASADGTVLVANTSGWGGGYGKYVVLRHANGTQTLYGHLSSVAVSVGQYVVQGQTLGGLGNSGRSTGPHIHFEIRGARNPF